MPTKIPFSIDDALLPAYQLFDRVYEIRAEKRIESLVDFDTDVTALANCQNCVNCGKQLTNKGQWLYCSDYCNQFARVVRRARKALADETVKREALENIAPKLPYIFSGFGYPTSKRRLSQTQRLEIFERDNYICKVCGAEAQEIDHISGSTDDPTNLQAICGPCNLAKRNLIAINPDDNPEEWDSIGKIRDELAFRIATVAPQKACDDESRWEHVWSDIVSIRRTIAGVKPMESRSSSHTSRLMNRCRRGHDLTGGNLLTYTNAKGVTIRWCKLCEQAYLATQAASNQRTDK